jgi:hypothetical protein
MPTNPGTVVAVRGSVVDVRFDAHLPPIYSVLRAGDEQQIVIEVLAQRDARHVRGIALTPTQGLARGMAVEDTGGPLQAPVGKTVLLTEMIHNMIGHQEGVSIFCGIGERCREGEELYREMKEAGVLPNMVMLFGQMNEPPGARFRVGHAALTDLATTSLEERMGEVFTRRLRELNGETKHGLAEALKTASEPALVRSAFDLPADQRAAIQNALNETFSAEVRVRFETAPDLVSGIELSSNGQKVAWSIADYLASLEKGVGELLKAKAESKPEEAKPLPRDK